MNCQKCNSSIKVKSGKMKGRQRYSRTQVNSQTKIKIQALHLYLEGLGFRSIGRILGVSNVSVLRWIRKFGQKAQELNTEKQQIEMVEVDEMHSYIGSKKTVLGMDCC